MTDMLTEAVPAPPAPDGRRTRRTNAQLERCVLVGRIVGSYEEMPGLILTLAQAARLFGIELEVCRSVLNDLVRDGKLRLSPGGYTRPDCST
jgi:hypothetical protein